MNGNRSEFLWFPAYAHVLSVFVVGEAGDLCRTLCAHACHFGGQARSHYTKLQVTCNYKWTIKVDKSERIKIGIEQLSM